MATGAGFHVGAGADARPTPVVEDLDGEQLLELLEYDGLPGNVCVPGVVALSACVAFMFGGPASAITGMFSSLHVAGQVFGATLGALMAAGMHKESVSRIDPRRLAWVMLGAAAGFGLSFLAVPADDDLGVLASSMLTSVGASTAAVATDPDGAGQIILDFMQGGKWPPPPGTRPACAAVRSDGDAPRELAELQHMLP